jgi:hypothetical protein
MPLVIYPILLIINKEDDVTKIPEKHEKYLFVVSLVLSGLNKRRAVTGAELHRWVLNRGREIRQDRSTYGFDRWGGAPFWEFIESMALSNFLRPQGGRPRDAQGWSESGLLLTTRGARVAARIAEYQ